SLHDVSCHSSPPAVPVPAPHRVEVVAIVGHEVAALHRSLFLLFLLLFLRPGDWVFAQSLRKFFPCRVRPTIHGPTIDVRRKAFANVPVRTVPAANTRMAGFSRQRLEEFLFFESLGDYIDVNPAAWIGTY